MSFSAPPGQPSILQTLSSSSRDTYALVQKNAIPVAIALAMSLIASIAVALSGWRIGGGPNPANPAAWFAPLQIPMDVVDLALMVVFVYSLAAAVRTLNPDFRMTAGRLFGFFGFSIVAVLLMLLAGLFFLIPAYWVGFKIMLTPYTYILTDSAPDALNRTWVMTTGYYWQTVGMFLLAGLCCDILLYLTFVICALLMSAAPLSLIVLGPLVTAVFIWVMQALCLIYVRWTNGLLPRANTPQAVPVPA